MAERRELFLTNELKEDLDPQTRAAYEVRVSDFDSNMIFLTLDRAQVELTRLDMERARKSRGA